MKTQPAQTTDTHAAQPPPGAAPPAAPASACGYCGRGDSVPLYPTTDVFGNDYTLRRCRACRAVFLSPRPDTARLAQAYDERYYGAGGEKFASPRIERFLDAFRAGRARRLARLLPPGAKVLDVGCGNGRFLRHLLARGAFEAHGVELPGNSARRAATVPGLRLKTGTLEPGDFPARSLDAVTMFHVFEHLTDPARHLDLVDGILREGGILAVSFPNIASAQSRLFKGRWLHLDPPRHLFFFEPDDFVALLRARGYALLAASHASLEQNPYGAVQSLLNCLLRRREVLFERLKGNRAYAPEHGPLSLLLQALFAAAAFPLFALTDRLAALRRRGATVELIFRRVGGAGLAEPPGAR